VADGRHGRLELAGGGEAKLVTGIDDHSRFRVAAGVVERATARAVCGVFAAALARRGVPEELLTDNGKVFTGRFGPHPGEVLFDRICRENGITHRLTAPRSPTTTGKIERFHKTLRTELLDGLQFDSLAQAQQVIDRWVEDYNTRRPHQALAMATPAERFQLPADPPLPAVPPKVKPAELQVWSPGQLRAFLAHVQGDRQYAAWLLAATTGMRRGELLGLRWVDVDLDAARIAVRQPRVVADHAVHVSEPKTARSRRWIAIDPVTAAALRQHQARQAADRAAVGPAY
jgi:hypothetical protein